MFSASIVLRPRPGEFNPWLDAGLYQLPFLVAARCCWKRALSRVADWRAWRTLTVGLVVFVGGNLYGSLVVGDQDIFPSPADAMWLSFYGLVYVAIVQMVRARVSRFQPSTWLDGAVGGLSAAALAVAFALGPTLSETEGKFSVVATTLAYPTADVLLMILLIASGIAIRTRDRAFWVLGLGLMAFCVSDIVYMFRESAGTYAEGGLLDVSWPLAAVIVGVAACLAGRSSPNVGLPGQQVVIPVASVISSLALLDVGQRVHLPILAVCLATAALSVATLRIGLTLREVTALAESRREARTDELTGLANRRHLLELLASAVERDAGPASLLIADLDGFKEINDSLGHIAGDELLSAVGRRLAGAAPSDTIVSRLGGDEFAVVLPNHGSGQALAVAEDLRTAIRRPFGIHGIQVTIDASIGVATSPDHGATAIEIMSRADVAMFRAKRQRSGIEVFDAERDTPSRDRLELLADLRAAFDGEQFLLHYQPQLDVATGEIVGVEALVRWQHPQRGLVPPDQFLALTEQCNLMSRLTKFVLEQALADCAELRRTGHRLRMSVNISASDLVGTELVELIGDLLVVHDLPPDSVVIEVTEESVMFDQVRCLQTLRRMRDAGLHISVDDYGTGQASLSYIRDLPITEIKLDRSFLVGVPADTHNAAIIRSTIELAHALDLPIVAEGIEDEETLVWLRSHGCDLGQGYHIARPVALPALLQVLGAPSAEEAAMFAECDRRPEPAPG